MDADDRLRKLNSKVCEIARGQLGPTAVTLVEQGTSVHAGSLGTIVADERDASWVITAWDVGSSILDKREIPRVDSALFDTVLELLDTMATARAVARSRQCIYRTRSAYPPTSSPETANRSRGATSVSSLSLRS